MRNYKAVLVLAVLGITLSMNAQNETFTVPSEKGEELRGQYVVLNIKGSAKENYSKVITMINKMYNTPSEVIKSQIENEYIRIEGVSNLFRGLPSTHTIEFNFKQDKIRIKLLNITSKGSEGIVNVINYCTYNKSHNKQGKPKNRLVKYSTEVVSGVNKLVSGIMLEISKDNSSSEDW